MAPPFFIVASARSGTTYLRLALNAHPEVAVPPESRFVTELYEGPEVDRDRFLARLGEHKRFAAWGLEPAAVGEVIGDRARLPYADAVAAAYAAYCRAQGKTRWGDKTPRYVENIPLLAGLFPDARFVHIIRDGRNVALSYSHVDFGPRNVARAARLWAGRVSTGMRDGRRLPPGRYLEISSEDLAEDPAGEVEDVCEFLDIPFDPTMLDEEQRARGAVDKPQHNYDPKVAGRPRMSSWETDMKLPDVEVFEAVAGHVLSECGYRRRFPTPGLSARLKASLALRGLPIGRL